MENLKSELDLRCYVYDESTTSFVKECSEKFTAEEVISIILKLVSNQLDFFFDNNYEKIKVFVEDKT